MIREVVDGNQESGNAVQFGNISKKTHKTNSHKSEGRRTDQSIIIALVEGSDPQGELRWGVTVTGIKNFLRITEEQNVLIPRGMCLTSSIGRIDGLRQLRRRVVPKGVKLSVRTASKK